MNMVAFLNGKDDEKALKIKVSAIYNWFFGGEFFESLVLLTKEAIFIGAQEKKISQVQALKELDAPFKVHITTFANMGEDVAKMFSEAKANLEGELKLGFLQKEKQYGPLQQEMEKLLAQENIVTKEVGGLVQESLGVKDPEEIEEIKKAARVCLHFENKLIEEIEEVIDSEADISHSKISSKIEKLLLNPKEQSVLEKKYGLVPELYDLSYMPIVQSGGKYDLRPQAESNDDPLSSDVVVCSVGGKYKEYNANLVRTLFINASPQQKHNYYVALELHEFLLEMLRANKPLSKLHQEATTFLKNKDIKLADKVQNYLGFGMGLEFRESHLIINARNEHILKENMVFNVCVGFQDLFDEEKKQKYAIMIADTVVVRKEEGECLTQLISRKFQDVSYQIDENEPQRKERPLPPPTSAILPPSVGRYNTRNARNSNQPARNEEKEKGRKEHQKELLARKQIELQERLKSGEFKQEEKRNTQIKAENLKTYQNEADINPIGQKQIWVDPRNNAVVIPIEGKACVFNVAVIKNVSKHEEGRFVSIRFNFHVQAGGVAPVCYPDPKNGDVFIREITVRMTDFQRANDVLKKIKELQKKVKQMMENRNNQQNEVEVNPEALSLNKGKRPLMNDLKVRPNLTGKKVAGSLEAHLDGFRYTTQNRSDKLDILYRNVKHAFFQPCDGEMVILLHLHLHRPVMVGKKKTFDVQFYTEAGVMVEDLDIRGRRNNYDQDEYEQEEREKQQRKKLNQEFEQFVKAVHQYTKEHFLFDVPYKQLGFYGTPQRSQVFLKPTVHCLVSLSENPCFVMTLDEVEVAYFERIQFGLRNFDLTFVFKNFERPVVRISAIPVESLEEVKNWLNQMDILYSEGTLNLNWPMVMAQIKQDMEGFVEDGGWGVILFDEEQEKDEQEQQEAELDQDSVFTVEDEDESHPEETEDSDDDEDEPDEDDDFESDYEDEEDLSEEGLDWDEMEKITKQKEDKARQARNYK